MIFLLKFGASFVLPPGLFFVALLGLAVYLRKRQRRAAYVLAIVTLLFYALSTTLVSDALLASLEGRYAPPERPQGDVIVVLGGGATSDTPDIDGAGNLSGPAANRLLTAARLQKALDLPIVAAGGKVYADTGREAEITRRMLLGLGVPEEKIFVEDQSQNTKQNAQFTKRLLDAHGWEQPLLVTSAFHMERSLLNFQKAGMRATPVPADYFVSRTRHFYFNRLAPSSAALDNSQIFFREWLGIWVARMVP